ncbi:MAG: hypothetical protein JWP69_2406 [Flaviaesturariibacter sp.]|nr:hypothetical protein [Flaviaesturariibacter sp.]
MNNSRKHIEEELRDLGSQLPMVSEQPLGVPDGYFDGLASTILARLKADEHSATEEISQLSPLLAGISRKIPFTVPADYFSNLTGDLSSLTSEDVSPLLSGISRTMPNAVPVGYFNGLSDQVLNKIEKPAAKVVSMNRKGWMRMAAAAVVAGIMAVSGIAYFGSNSTANVQSTAWMEKGLKGVSDAGLKDFIETTDAVHQDEVAQTTLHTAEVRNMMTDVSDSDMDAFLAQVPTDDEELLIIN